MAYDDGEKKESDITKALLYLVLIVAVGVLAYQNYQKNQQLTTMVEAQRDAEALRTAASLKLEARKEATARAEAERDRDRAISDRDRAFDERDIAIRERDEARLVAANERDELARATNSTPRPLTWFEQRQAGTGAKLDAPAVQNSTRVRPGGVYYYP